MKKILLSLTLVMLIAGLTKAQWAEQTTGITSALRSISAVDDNVAWTCGNTGRVVRTTNGGTSWAAVTNPANFDLYNIFGIDANTALTTYSSGGTFVYRTSNGGANWTQVFTQSGAAAFINSIWMITSTNGFMQGDPVGGRWSLWKTSNGGVSWDSTGLYLPDLSEAGWNNGVMVLGTNIWYVTNSVRLYYSTNTGASWTQQTLPAGGTFGTIWLNSNLLGMASQAGLLYRTTNSGTAWIPSTLPGTATINGITGRDNFWFAVRGANTIYKSTDNGITWTTDYTSPSGTYNHIQKALNGNRIWAVKSNGTISKSDQLIGIIPISGEIPTVYSLSQNYPNPFNPTTKINFAIPKSSNIVLKAYNILGEEAAVIYSGYLTAGKYLADFNASNLASGIYFYTLNADGFTATKKMTLVK